MIFDTVVKSLLKGIGGAVSMALAGARIVEWLPLELPKVQNPRVDLLGESEDGTLRHIELQSTNERDMPLRVAEYFLGIYRYHGRFPRQALLYIGSDKMRMPNRLQNEVFSFEYPIVDARTLDSERLLASPEISDNIMAVLADFQSGAIGC